MSQWILLSPLRSMADVTCVEVCHKMVDACK